MDKLHNPEKYQFLDLSEIDDNELDQITSTLYPLDATREVIDPTLATQSSQETDVSWQRPHQPESSQIPQNCCSYPQEEVLYNNNNNSVIKNRNQFIDNCNQHIYDDNIIASDGIETVCECSECKFYDQEDGDSLNEDIYADDDDGGSSSRPFYCDTPNSQCSSSVSNQWPLATYPTDDNSSYVILNNVPYNHDPNQSNIAWTDQSAVNYIDMPPHANGSGSNNNPQQSAAQTNIPPQNQQQQQQQPSPQQLYQSHQPYVANQMGMYPVQLPSNMYVSNVTTNVNVHGYMGHNVPSPGAYMTAAAQPFIPVDVQQAGQQQQVQGPGALMEQSPSPMSIRSLPPRRSRGGRINGNHRREYAQRQAAPSNHPAEMMNPHGVDPQQMMSTYSYFYPQYAPAYYHPSNAIGHTGGGHPNAQHATGTPLFHMPMYAAPTPTFYNYQQMMYPQVLSPDYQQMDDRGDDHSDVGANGGMPQMWQPMQVLYQNPHPQQQMHPSQMHQGHPPPSLHQPQSQEDYIEVIDDMNQNAAVMQQSPHLLSPRSDMSQIHHSMEYLPQQQSPVMVEVATSSPIPPQLMQSPQEQQMPTVLMLPMQPSAPQQQQGILTYAEPTAPPTMNPMHLNIVCDGPPPSEIQVQQHSPVEMESTHVPQAANQNYQNIINNNFVKSCEDVCVMNNQYPDEVASTNVSQVPLCQYTSSPDVSINVGPTTSSGNINNVDNVILPDAPVAHVQNQVVPNSNANVYHSDGGAPLCSSPATIPAPATPSSGGFIQNQITVKKPVTSIATTTTQDDVNKLATATNEKLMIKSVVKPPAWKKATASVAVTAVPSTGSLAVTKQPTVAPFQNHNNKLMTQKQQTISETKSTASTAAPQDLPDKEFKAITSQNSQIIITSTVNKPVTIIHKDQEVQLPLAPPPPPPSAAIATNEASTPSWASLLKISSISSTAVPAATTPTQVDQPRKLIAKMSPFDEKNTGTVAMPPGGMSYSAASSQGLTGPPQSSNTADRRSVRSPIKQEPKLTGDEMLNKLGDFFRRYQTENNNVSLRARGLTNRSNYCYINAILQALVGCPQFYNLIRSIPIQTATLRQKAVAPTIEAMIELVSEFSHLPPGARLHRREKTQKKEDVGYDLACDPSFEPTAIHKLWNGSRQDVEGRQEDAEEFLSHLLNKINDEMLELMKMTHRSSGVSVQPQNGAGPVTIETNDDGDEWQLIYGARNKGSVTRSTDFGRTPVSDIFRGELRSRLQREGDHVKDEIQPFFTLQLNIEKAASVKEALEILVGKDKLEGVTCSKTNQEVPAWQQMYLEKLPLVLILHLKWFSYKVDGCSKIVKNVDFPIELKIDSKILSSKKYTPKQKSYKLFAVVYHDGKEASKGHYITDVYHFGYSSWLRYDDSSVKPINENAVLHPRNPRVPYLLYYRRCDTLAPTATTTGVSKEGMK